MRRYLTIFGLLITITDLVSCRKKLAERFVGCRISKITQPNPGTGVNYTYVFSYNDRGTLSEVKTRYGDTELRKTIFSYSRGYELATTYWNDNKVFSYQDSLALDGSGRVTYINRHWNSASATAYWDRFFYDTDGTLLFHSQNKNGGDNTDSLGWSNGDVQVLVQTDLAGARYEADYLYSDTLYNTGNTTARLTDLLSYGRSIYYNRHLRKRIIWNVSSRHDTTYCSYKLDKDGKMIYMDDRQSGLSPVSIDYDCH